MCVRLLEKSEIPNVKINWKEHFIKTKMHF